MNTRCPDLNLPVFPGPRTVSPPEQTALVAEVVILKKTDRVLHYSIPVKLRDRIKPGMRVLVPLRADWLTGIVIRSLGKSDVPHLKPIIDLLDDKPQLNPTMMALARWLADYYLTGWGAALKAILPPGLDVAGGRRYRISEKGRSALSQGEKGRIVGGTILSILSESSRGLRHAALIGRVRKMDPSGHSNSRTARQLSTLTRKGWIEEMKVMPRTYKPRQSVVPKGVLPLNPYPFSEALHTDDAKKQSALPQNIFQSIRDKHFLSVCLEGPLSQTQPAMIDLIRESLCRGRSVILLVPEIGRVAPWVARLQNGGLGPIGVLHGGLPDRTRRSEWERVRLGETKIVIGTRLAVLAPVDDPGLILVEEEQDPAYKQEESPRYHTRDVAVMRAANHKSLIVLTSQSPSVETYANIQSGKYRSVRLEKFRPGPLVHIIDLGQETSGISMSRKLLGAIAIRFEKKEPVILILNRRGFNTALCCQDCGAVVRCARCQVAQVYSKKKNKLSCHYCGSAALPPAVCPSCKSTRLALIGSGTERIEDLLRTQFPSARIARLDRDTAQPNDVSVAIDQLNRSELDILVGTQRVMNGPGLTRPGLIGLLLADGAFHFPDFRAGEQTFQLIARVRNFSDQGEVMIQTYYPKHESIVWAVEGYPEAFYEKELAYRKALYYPPSARLVVLTVKAMSESRAVSAARYVSETLRQVVEEIYPDGNTNHSKNRLQILGPIPSVKPQLHGKHRQQILVKAPDSRLLHQVVQKALQQARTGSALSGVWLELDVDPQRIV